jgi:hypothetical protein
MSNAKVIKMGKSLQKPIEYFPKREIKSFADVLRDNMNTLTKLHKLRVKIESEVGEHLWNFLLFDDRSLDGEFATTVNEFYNERQRITYLYGKEKWDSLTRMTEDRCENDRMNELSELIKQEERKDDDELLHLLNSQTLLSTPPNSPNQTDTTDGSDDLEFLSTLARQI